jgi:hypothetical protein
MIRHLTAAGTVLVAFVGLWVAPLAGSQLLVLGLTTALAVGVGAEAHARLRPQFGRLNRRPFDGFWIGPALTALASALVAARLEPTLQHLVPFVGAALVGLLLYAQDRELSDHGQERWAPLSFALVLYLVSFALFVVLYTDRSTLPLTALACGLSALLLAGALFRPSGAPPQRRWLFAALVGLCVGELILALGSWISTGLLGGAFLLLYFYVTAGLVQALLDSTLDARLALEYSLVGLVGLVLILSSSPWRA